MTSIQLLRAIAAWLVVSQHFVEVFIASQHRTPNVVAIGLFGSVGVDIFFVISGIVMTKSVLAHSYSPSEFFKNRMHRIIPAYWAWTVIAIILAFALGYPSDHGRLFVSGEISLENTIKSWLFVPFLSQGAPFHMPLLGVGWTLNFEMFFYALLALAIIGGQRLGLIVCATAVFFLPDFWPPDWTYATVAANNLLKYFSAGIIIGFLAFQFRINFKILAFVSVVCFTIFLYLTSDNAVVPTAIALVPIPVILTFMASEKSALLNELPGLNFLKYLGKISYSTYLCHFIVYSLVAHFTGHLDTPASILVGITMLPIAIIGASSASYHFIERQQYFSFLDFGRPGKT